MKKILTILGITVASFAYSQGGTLVVNNYTPYDYYGAIMANNFSGGCYPYVSPNTPNSMITVPANANMGTGTELRYVNYKDQYTSSLYPINEWNVSVSATTTQQRLWNHPAVGPASPVGLNTKWGHTKFQMFYAGTTNNVPGYNANLGLAGNPCTGASDNFTTISGANSAEMFIISSGGINYTYIQLY
ncbi:hypothetical protein SAMN05421594_1201 [Chryseobacterium oleae]|uniref:Uncharacterized protein n=1 Tax=Chryseobacterium oleae TaxID=491207 RepID=A0A1I4WHP3_CHROL|nr:hypothetical protein [Chryseobacterium oleae]SFN12790.1 hypothetical protein SAMN05421594_1201 [Chryseobacterium oleae]